MRSKGFLVGVAQLLVCSVEHRVAHGTDWKLGGGHMPPVPPPGSYAYELYMAFYGECVEGGEIHKVMW